MASEDLQRTIAVQVASGFSTADIARFHDYTYGAMHRLIKTDVMQERVEKHRTYLKDVWSRVYFRMSHHGEQLAAGMLEEAFNENSAKQFEARKYCLEQLKPAATNHSGSLDINVGIAQKILVELGDTLSKAIEVRSAQGADIEDSRHLREGREMIPDLAPVYEDGGAPPAPPVEPASQAVNPNPLDHPSTPADLAGNDAAQEYHQPELPFYGEKPRG